MEFLRIFGEPSRCQLLPVSGQKISISLLSPATSSQYLSGIIEAALPGLGAETAAGPNASQQPNCGGTLPNVQVHRRQLIDRTRNDIRALPRQQSRNSFMSNF
jgi:hypothetical protein